MTDRKLYIGPLTDNRRWDHIKARADDVYVVTPPKCGTTWMQTIVALLFFGDPAYETELSVKMPWIDIRIREIDEVAARVEAMPHRRSLKSHTPLDGLPYTDQGQYICVFRHPLDAHYSFRKHVRNVPFGGMELFYPEDEDTEIMFKRFLDGAAEGYDMDAMPLAHILRHYKAARALADRPNVSLFHYADMRADLAGQMARAAVLLDVEYSPDQMARLVEAATFDNMKANADRFAPSGGKGFFKSDSDFFHSGTSAKWEGQLTYAQMAAYDAAMDAALSSEDRQWLEYGAGGTDA